MIVALAGLMKIELPSRTLRFSDGGFLVYEGETYRSKDAVFGTIGALQSMSEGVGGQIPAMNMTLLPPDTSGPVELSDPANQQARVTMMIVEYDPETGVAISGDTLFSGQVDQTALKRAKTQKELAMTIVSLMERLFEKNIGNTMNPSFHKSIWAGETGQDQATGLTVPIAWGTEKPAGGGSRGGGSGGGSVGGWKRDDLSGYGIGGGLNLRQMYDF